MKMKNILLKCNLHGLKNTIIEKITEVVGIIYLIKVLQNVFKLMRYCLKFACILGKKRLNEIRDG